jgi:hypothetical protein
MNNNNNFKKITMNVLNVLFYIIFYILVIINLRLIIYAYLYFLLFIFKKVSLITFGIIDYLLN